MLRNIPSYIRSVRQYSKKTLHGSFDELTQQLSTPSKSEASSKAVEELDWSHLGETEADIDPESQGSGRTEQKEEMIFKEVLSQVLSSKPNMRNPSTTLPLKKPVKNSPLTDSILALFDKPARSSQEASNSSLMDGLLESAKPQLSPQEIAKKEDLNRNLEPVLHHISSMKTNHEVLEYYETVIIPRFDPEGPSLTAPCTATEPAVTGETISLLLEKSISVLTNDFSDILGAFHLFEISKHHSIDFFTMACSGDVYNHIIRIRWDNYRDLYAVVNLAAEIAINAIQPNLETTELLARVYREALDSSRGIESKLGMPLWSGQDMKRLEELSRYRIRFQSTWASKPTLRF